MNTKKFVLLATLLLCGQTAFAQHDLQLNSPTGATTLLLGSNPGGTFTFPNGTGTIMVNSGGVSPVWLVGGNNTPSSPNIGSLTSNNLLLTTNNVTRATFAAVPSSTTALLSITNTTPSIQRVRINGSKDATATSTLAANPGVWDMAVDGDKFVTGLMKTGGSIWIDGNSSTNTISANQPLNVTTSTSDALAFGTNGADRITIAPNGFVGIGVPNPVSQLHIRATPPDPTISNAAGYLTPDPINHVLVVENMASNSRGNGIAIIIHNPSSANPITDGDLNDNQTNYMTFYNDNGDRTHIKGRIEGFSYNNYLSIVNALAGIVGNGDILNPFNYFTCNIGWDPNFIQFHSDFITWPTFSFTDLSFDLGCVDFGTIAGIFDVGTLCAGSVDVGNVIPTFSGGSIGSPLTISGPPITGLSNPFSINHSYIDNIAAQLRLLPYKGKAAGIIANPLNAAVNIGSSFLGGVTFESGAGDYAEWLERANHDEKLTIGDVVAVVGGKITKNTTGASQFMIVSWKPCVLGNTPEVGKEQFYNKVAFMGQIPVKMTCAVKKGDYIVPDGNNNGFAKAISPNELTSENMSNVLGVAWQDAPFGVKFVKVVVGLRPNEMASVIQDQAKKIENLRAKALELDKLNAEVAEIESAMKPASVLKTAAKKTTASKKKQLSSN